MARPSETRGRPRARDGMVMTSFYLPPRLHRRLRHRAVDIGRPASDIIREAIEEWLARHGKGGQ